MNLSLPILTPPRILLSLLGALTLMGGASFMQAQTATSDATSAMDDGALTTTNSGATIVVNNSSLTLSGATFYSGTTTLGAGTLTLGNVGSDVDNTATTTLVSRTGIGWVFTDPLTDDGTLTGANTTAATRLVLMGTGNMLGTTDPLALSFVNNSTGLTIRSGSSTNYGTLIDYGSVSSLGSSISLGSALSSGSFLTVVGGPPSTAVTKTLGGTFLLGSATVISSGTSILSNVNAGTITLDVSGTSTAADMVNYLGTLPVSGTLVVSSGGILNLTGMSAAGLTVTGNTNVIGGTALGSTGLTLTSAAGTTQPTGTVNVTTLGSVPVGNTPTSVSFAAPAVALLGIGNVGAQGISERGIIYSLTSANGSPTLGASGVVKVVHTGNPTANGSFSLTAAGLAPNTSYTYRVYATDSTGATTLSTPATFTTPTVLQNWRQTFFGTIQGTNHAADSADPDGDGEPNLLEFATGKNPTTPQNATPPANTSVTGSQLEYTYSRSLDALNSGVTFTVEWNDSLDPSLWSSAGVTEIILSDDGLKQQVKASVPAGGGGRRFMRLKVLPPGQ